MWSHFKRSIFTGLIAIVPLALTLWILKVILSQLDRLTAPILKALKVSIPGLGIILTVVMVYFLGLFVTNVLGRRLFQWAEKIITSIPLVSTIYKAIKQITHAFSGAASSRNFQRVIYIQYPRVGLWTMAFVTGESIDERGNEYFHVFVPTTPNPTSGFFIVVPKKDTLKAQVNVEEGLKAIISGGLLAPTKNPLRQENPVSTDP